jgi:predicted N-acetyltransferase YhbS
MQPYSQNCNQFTVRSETAHDILAIRALNIEVFNGEKEANLVDRLRREKRFDPDMSLIAEDEHGQIVGHVLLSHIECITDSGPVKTGAIAPGAVKKDYRGLVLGRQLMLGILHQAKRHDFELLLLLARPKVYGRIGFSAKLAQKIESVYSGVGESFMALELKKGCIENSLFARASYPDAFAECDS